MKNVAIPTWDSLGLLPPIDTNDPTSAERSPYPVSLADLVMRFSTSQPRCTILRGFLEYRAALHRQGYVNGFQWLDGSFLEDVETLNKRAPRDIDVVTFVHKAEPVENPPDDDDVFDHDAAKTKFMVDSYYVEIDEISSRELTLLSSYWYSMWSHRRNQVWKGFLQIELSPSEDAAAAAWLSQSGTNGGQP